MLCSCVEDTINSSSYAKQCGSSIKFEIFHEHQCLRELTYVKQLANWKSSLQVNAFPCIVVFIRRHGSVVVRWNVYDQNEDRYLRCQHLKSCSHSYIIEKRRTTCGTTSHQTLLCSFYSVQIDVTTWRRIDKVHVSGTSAGTCTEGNWSNWNDGIIFSQIYIHVPRRRPNTPRILHHCASLY